MKLRVVGLGAVGTRVMLNALERGHTVLPIDRVEGRLEEIRSGDCPHVHDRAARFIGRTLQLRQEAADDSFDGTLVCVSTADASGAYDHSSVVDVLNALPRISRGEVIAIESTVAPGATSSVFRESLASRGIKIGVHAFLVASPERVDTTSSIPIAEIPKLVGGVTTACTAAGVAMYRTLVNDVVPVSHASVAEAAKLLENVFRYVNVSFANEFASLAASLGVGPHEIIAAASTKPFGFMAFWPSAGAGGPCIPLAASIYEQTALQQDDSSIVRSCIRSEATVCAHIEKTIASHLKRNDATLGRILILGATYKSFATSIAGSPAIRLATFLAGRDYEVLLSDPYLRPGNLAGAGSKFAIVAPDAILGPYDAVIITSWHEEFESVIRRVQSRALFDYSGSADARTALRRVPTRSNAYSNALRERG